MCFLSWFMAPSLQLREAGFLVASCSNSHCGGGTGAAGWAASPGRGAGGSVRVCKEHNGKGRENMIILQNKQRRHLFKKVLNHHAFQTISHYFFPRMRLTQRCRFSVNFSFFLHKVQKQESWKFRCKGALGYFLYVQQGIMGSNFQFGWH